MAWHGMARWGIGLVAALECVRVEVERRDCAFSGGFDDEWSNWSVARRWFAWAGGVWFKIVCLYAGAGAACGVALRGVG